MRKSDDEIKRVFAENLRQARQEAGMTQDAFTRVHPTLVSQYENGHVAPDIVRVARLAEELGIPASALLKGL